MIVKISDKDEIERVVMEILKELPDWFGIPEYIEEYAKDSRDMLVYTYLVQEEKVGFVTIKQTSESAAEVYVIGIRKEYQNQGIGTKLIYQCEEYCKENSLHYLQVKTLDHKVGDPFYLKTWEFYKTMGFEPLEVLPLWDECNPCLVMIKYIKRS